MIKKKKNRKVKTAAVEKIQDALDIGHAKGKKSKQDQGKKPQPSNADGGKKVRFQPEDLSVSTKKKGPRYQESDSVSNDSSGESISSSKEEMTNTEEYRAVGSYYDSVKEPVGSDFVAYREKEDYDDINIDLEIKELIDKVPDLDSNT